MCGLSTFWLKQENKRLKNDAIQEMIANLNTELLLRNYCYVFRCSHGIVVKKIYNLFLRDPQWNINEWNCMPEICFKSYTWGRKWGERMRPEEIRFAMSLMMLDLGDGYMWVHCVILF